MVCLMMWCAVFVVVLACSSSLIIYCRHYLLDYRQTFLCPKFNVNGQPSPMYLHSAHSRLFFIPVSLFLLVKVLLISSNCHLEFNFFLDVLVLFEFLMPITDNVRYAIQYMPRVAKLRLASRMLIHFKLDYQGA